MPNYVVQVSRVAKPGHTTQVLEAVVAQAESGSGRRNVSISVNADTGSGHLIVGAMVLDSIDEVEALSDKVSSTPELRSNAESIDSHCESSQVEILRVIEPMENPPSEAKFMVRNLIKAQPGKAGELLSTLLELRSQFDNEAHLPLITIPFVGDQDLVRATAMYSNLGGLEAQSDQLNTDVLKPYIDKIKSLRQSYVRHTARMVFMSS
ncbi:MAG: hypothetical protein VX917_02795 [Chloroflexota bacterium]|jgi:hypothetical protein|nr:hypothetical protein [Chloroflexota bacterium]MEC9438348.1 hypothetical protein [Chloroflexota bacterium]|tara:strand:+ start:481 stop:1104 length:624 start_codon:yes stop_codon:yes gene_type:complete